jgi:hypothetical protein
LWEIALVYRPTMNTPDEKMGRCVSVLMEHVGLQRFMKWHVFFPTHAVVTKETMIDKFKTPSVLVTYGDRH